MKVRSFHLSSGQKWAVAGLFALAFVFSALWWINQPPPMSKGGVFTIEPGASARQVAWRLQEAGHIRSRHWFVFLARAMGASHRLKKGSYDMRGGQTTTRVIKDLVSGKTFRVKVTLPEGFAFSDMARRLEDAGVCSAAAFRALAEEHALEGLLFPDTYFWEPATPPERVIRVMRLRFERVWEDVVSTARRMGAVSEVMVSPENINNTRLRLADGRVFTRKEIVTLASIIQREALRDDERPLVSAVYHNRLKKRMRLEADPTVQYALGYWKSRILYVDLDIESPYNTYRRFGLPPGPISNPGKSSLLAALAPAHVDYLYFVADMEGGHHFARSYSEHKNNVRQRNRNREKHSSSASR